MTALVSRQVDEALDRLAYNAQTVPGLEKRDAALATVRGEIERLRAHAHEANQQWVTAEEHARRLESGLRELRVWFETEPWKGDPDSGSFGGRPYSGYELSLGYGTYRDPRFLPALLADRPDGTVDERQDG